ncbi:hypothetical protein OG232_04845 [Streptomyces sp. NBC_01411]|uniref:hypothetical protein n=1 Tax=Streptomyces sp. NBC_01411 TaxID=2903857 RepID=UPI003253FFD7
MREAIAPWSPPQGESVELIGTGTSWDAVRVSAQVGRAVVDCLGDQCGAVIVDGYGLTLYWLIRPGSADAWTLPSYLVSILGPGAYVAVPPAKATSGPGLWWGLAPTPLRCFTDAELLHSAIEAEIAHANGPRP